MTGKTIKTHKPKSNDVTIEEDGSYYFPAWGIHVAKTVKTIKKSASKPFTQDGVRKIRVTEREVKVQVAKTVEDAKAHIKKAHGIDVDKDTSPPQTDKKE